MLSCIRRPTIAYDLSHLAEDSCVSVGRETDAHIQLDSQDIPCLLSRKHAHLMLQPGGSFTLVDLGSTNGTFAARQNQPLRKLPPGYTWELQHGDTVGFGGPETIIVKRAQVGNPFLFKYYTPAGWQQQNAVQPHAAPAQTLPPPASANVPVPHNGTTAGTADQQPLPAHPIGHSQAAAPDAFATVPSIVTHAGTQSRNSRALQEQQDMEEDVVMKDRPLGSPNEHLPAADLARHSSAAHNALPVPQDVALNQHLQIMSVDGVVLASASFSPSRPAHISRPPHAIPPQHCGKENAQQHGLPNTTTNNQQQHGKGAQQHHAAHAGLLLTPRSNQKQAVLAERVHNHLTCPVCCDLLVSTHMLHCGHMFCGLCLATWMTQNQSCPSCRKPITGVPVRCFTIDNMIAELVHNSNHAAATPGAPAAAAATMLSPTTRQERLRKQEHWDNVQRHIVQDWVAGLQRRRDAALQEAQRHNQELQQAGLGGPAPPLPVVAPQQLMHPVAAGGAGVEVGGAGGVVSSVLAAIGAAQEMVNRR